MMLLYERTSNIRHTAYLQRHEKKGIVIVQRRELSLRFTLLLPDISFV